ncbi:hypothetical protein ACFQ9V_01055 [Leifsonia sp. NPDC056665]|uniref:hypothetical protein n=1 Tax=Leifsonia sp. NPDC056665 TaxID=3345901 RepID=UPI0036B1E015
MSDSDQRPGFRAHEDSLRLPFDELTTRLRHSLGVRLVGLIGNVTTASEVSSWADGHSTPGDAVQERLRCAYQVTELLRDRYDAVTVQTWFKGRNASLDDVAPAQLLREGDPTEAGRKVLAAATDFAYIG